MKPELRESVLREFAALPAADRRAIAERLSPQQRKLVQKLLKRDARAKAPQALPPPPRTPDLSRYSPWLARHVRRVLDPKNKLAAAGLTDRARETLIGLLPQQAPRSSR